MGNSYQRRKSDFENAISLVVKTLRAQGATDPEIVTFLRLNLAPEPKPSTGIQSAIGKALRNPGFAVTVTDEGTRAIDFRPAALIHNPHGEVPTGDPRAEVAKSLFDPYRRAADEGTEAGRLAKAHGIIEAAEDADHHDLTAKTRKARARKEAEDREQRLRGR